MQGYCGSPFDSLSIGIDGVTFLCSCEGWMTKSAGNILDYKSFKEFYSSPTVLEIQQTILDKTYSYCNLNSCGFNGNESSRPEPVNSPDKIFLTYDRSCQLQCPSCRDELINTVTSKAYQVNKHVEKLLYDVDKDICVNVTGSGDPFASKLFRDLIYKWSENPLSSYVKLELQTNGLMLQKCWPNINPSIVDIIRISFDAATKETYSKTRFPGNFDTLLENVSYIADQRKKYNFTLMADFVIQTDNYLEMADYIKICTDFGFDQISFTVIQPWAMPQQVFKEKAVWQSDHIDYEKFITNLRNIDYNNYGLGWLVDGH